MKTAASFFFAAAVSVSCCAADTIDRKVVWRRAELASGRISEAVALPSLPEKNLYATGGFRFHAEVDERGDGVWSAVGLKKRASGIYDLRYLSAKSIRLVTDEPVTNATAVLVFARRDSAAEPAADAVIWSDSEVKAGVPSAPIALDGFGGKYLHLSADREAKLTVELDISGDGDWIVFRTFRKAEHLNISNLRAAALRIYADCDCRASARMTSR